MKIPKIFNVPPLVGIGPVNAVPWIRKGISTVVDKVKQAQQRSNEAVKLQNQDMAAHVKFNRYESTSDTLKRHGIK